MNLGAWELLDVIGRGAMGIVYRGRDRQSGQIVAVKIIDARVAASPTLLRRFEQECAATNRLEHPNVVRALSCGIERGEPYLVMEYVDGLSLAHQVREAGPMRLHAAGWLTLRLAEALTLAHQHGFIHRDVKPENVLISREGVPKLGDLGLVKDLRGDPSLTQSGAWLGTVDYMAPEQFGNAKNVDLRSDVYGLAGTLYYALTGTVPFPARGELAILKKKVRNDLTPIHQVVPGLPESLNKLLQSALDADPEGRPPTCGAFALRLEGLLAKHPADVVTPEEEPPDLRQERRFPAATAAVCRPVLNGTRFWPSKIRDVSATGVCLELDRRYEPGTLLTVEVGDEGTNGHVAVVRWVNQTAANRWNVGCAFTRRLSNGELSAILDHKSPTIVVCPSAADLR